MRHDSALLLKDYEFEIKTILQKSTNESGELNYSDFCFEWNNYELDYSLGYTPTEKQAKELLDSWKFEPIEKKYYDSWWAKIKRINSGEGNEKIDGVLVDRYSASMVYQLVTKLNEKNQEKMLSYSFPVAWHITTELYKDIREGKL